MHAYLALAVHFACPTAMSRETLIIVNLSELSVGMRPTRYSYLRLLPGYQELDCTALRLTENGAELLGECAVAGSRAGKMHLDSPLTASQHLAGQKTRLHLGLVAVWNESRLMEMV